MRWESSHIHLKLLIDDVCVCVGAGGDGDKKVVGMLPMIMKIDNI